VNKSAKDAQKRKGKGVPANADASGAAPEPPRKWNDYTVQFEFPPVTELASNSLMQARPDLIQNTFTPPPTHSPTHPTKPPLFDSDEGCLRKTPCQQQFLKLFVKQ